MGDQTIFKRYEIKYRLKKEQYRAVVNAMSAYMRPDEHGRNTILSLYFDTPDYLLVRKSIDKPEYKEKLRLRSYGLADSNTTVFIELKKKYDSVVYKRRFGLTEAMARKYLFTNEECKLPDLSWTDRQIKHEIDYTLEHYGSLEPRVLLSYEREAYYAVDDHEFRVTFDQNILWRDYDVDLTSGIYGQPILGEDEVLMEVKVGGAMPLWFSQILTENHLYQTSFSKYGTAYKTIYNRQMMEENISYVNIISGDLRFHSNDNFGAKVSAMRERQPVNRRHTYNGLRLQE